MYRCNFGEQGKVSNTELYEEPQSPKFYFNFSSFLLLLALFFLLLFFFLKDGSVKDYKYIIIDNKHAKQLVVTDFGILPNKMTSGPKLKIWIYMKFKCLEIAYFYFFLVNVYLQ